MLSVRPERNEPPSASHRDGSVAGPLRSHRFDAATSPLRPGRRRLEATLVDALAVWSGVPAERIDRAIRFQLDLNLDPADLACLLAATDLAAGRPDLTARLDGRPLASFETVGALLEALTSAPRDV